MNELNAIAFIVFLPILIFGLIYLRFGPQVWKYGERYYSCHKGPLYVGTTYRRWDPVCVVIPGLVYCCNGKQSFYTNNDGFEPIWKLGFWPKKVDIISR